MTYKSAGLLEAIQVPPSPFPGLRPFEFSESHLFFGRDGQTEKMLDMLADTRFLAVTGTSGSGKSSLVRAGMTPALRAGMMTGAGSNWRIAIMRPGNDPIGNLARALNAPEIFGSDDTENAAIQIAIAEATLRLGSRGLIETVRQTAMPNNENLLVVVDQFEELFRFAREARKAKDERFDNDVAAFVKLLLEAIKPNESGQREANIYVALTMRSDFLGDCSQFWDLPEAINESQYLIPRLTRDQLREVIEGPVALGGGEITSRLVNQLLNDIGDDQDQLPILQHALMRTWDEWKQPKHEHQSAPGAIDQCCYEEIGGMANALSKHADEAYRELPNVWHRKIAEKVFRCLTEKGEDNREIRRPVVLRELCEVAKANAADVITTIETFRLPGRSFLMPPAEIALCDGTLIDISHESLIRVWKRLCKWVSREAESAAIYRRLVETAKLSEDQRAELWRGADLESALKWQKRNKPTEAWARRYHPNLAAALAFLHASERKRAEDLAENERVRQQESERAKRDLELKQALDRTRRMRRQILALFSLLAMLVSLIIFALFSRSQAVEAIERARKATEEEQRARILAAEEGKKLSDREREWALMQTMKAEEIREFAEQKTRAAQRARDNANRAFGKAKKAQEAARQLAARELAAKLKQLAEADEVDQLNAIIDSIRIVADNRFAFAASSIEIDASGTGSDRWFQFELFPEIGSIKSESNKIAKISYILAHPTFTYKLFESTRSNNFKVSYTGWGCLKEVIAVVEYSDPVKAPLITIYNMCEKLGSGWMQ